MIVYLYSSWKNGHQGGMPHLFLISDYLVLTEFSDNFPYVEI